MQVLSDGAITFDRPIRLYTPLQFPLRNRLFDLQIVSVFLADHDPRESGQVRYAVATGTASQNVQAVSSFIRNKGFSDDFNGNWMLVAEWRDVPEYPGTKQEAVSNNN